MRVARRRAIWPSQLQSLSLDGDLYAGRQLYNLHDTINERFLNLAVPKLRLETELEAISNLNRDLVKFGGLV